MTTGAKIDLFAWVFVAVIVGVVVVTYETTPLRSRAADPPSAEAVEDALVHVEAQLGHSSRSVVDSELFEVRRELAAAWRPAEDSPLSLLPLSEALGYRPTEASLRRWIATVPEIAELDPEWTDELEALWTICQEQRALRAFIGQHHDRAYLCWSMHKSAVALRDELAPARNFIRAHLGDADEFWQLVDSYSAETYLKIQSEGAGADSSAYEAAKWPLQHATVAAGSAAFEALLEILKGNQ